MCGRYYIEDSPELQPLAEAMNRSPLADIFRQTTAVLSQGEISPGAAAPVIALNRSGRRTVFPMKWGFGGKPLLINARTETAAFRPAFRDSWRSRRCVVPASWYFEWEHFRTADGKRRTGGKYKLRPMEDSQAWLCGLYRMEEGLPHFVILTREPGEGIRFIHDRMPLMLPERRIDEWISPEADPVALMREARTDILFERVSAKEPAEGTERR